MAASAVTSAKVGHAKHAFRRADVAEPADHTNDEDRRVVEVDQCYH